jgi:hypothetical protein
VETKGRAVQDLRCVEFAQIGNIRNRLHQVADTQLSGSGWAISFFGHIFRSTVTNGISRCSFGFLGVFAARKSLRGCS